jgi:hypothetical protein
VTGPEQLGLFISVNVPDFDSISVFGFSVLPGFDLARPMQEVFEGVLRTSALELGDPHFSAADVRLMPIQTNLWTHSLSIIRVAALNYRAN